MLRNIKQRRRQQYTLIVFATACWQKRTFCAGAHAVECTLRERHPARSAFLSKRSREPAASDSVPGTHASSSSRLGALRFCRVTRAAQPRAVQPAAGTALLPKRRLAKNQD